MIKVVSKQLYCDYRKIIHFICCSAEVSSVLIQFHIKMINY